MLRRSTTTFIRAMLAAALCTGIVGAPAADAAVAKPRVFINCPQLNQVYPHGVGKVGAHDRGKGKNFRPVTTFKRDNALYRANLKRDADKDGIACEKR